MDLSEVAVMPSESPRKGTFSGRKFSSPEGKNVSRPKSSPRMLGQQSKSALQSAVSLTQNAKKKYRNTSMAELQNMLEQNDKILHNTKLEMNETQQSELQRAKSKMDSQKKRI
mmetsp:Transcript_19864/g.19976  ORF Transcript_19864/g.19976 Transcript_19864/m.19976 type:complete len:113 (+) Transcript_19864:69-407(+)